MSLQKILQEEYEKNMKTFLEPAALLSLIEEIMELGIADIIV